MATLKKLTTLAAASALALGLGTAANAAVFVQDGDPTGSDVDQSGNFIVTDAGVEFINNDLNLAGDFIADNNTATVIVGEGVNRIALDFDVDQAVPNGPRARGVYNFSVMVVGNMGSNFRLDMITDPQTGVLMVPSLNEFEVMSGEELTFMFSGTAFANDTNFTPGYSVAAFGVNEVPVPAAGLLFGTAAIGGALARRKRKAA